MHSLRATPGWPIQVMLFNKIPGTRPVSWPCEQWLCSEEVPCAWGLMLWDCCLDLLTDFIFKSGYCKWNLMGCWSMCWVFGVSVYLWSPHPARVAPSSSVPAQYLLLSSASSGDLGKSVRRSGLGACALWVQSQGRLWAPLRVCTYLMSIPVWKEPRVVNSKLKKKKNQNKKPSWPIMRETREEWKMIFSCFLNKGPNICIWINPCKYVADFVNADWNLRSTGVWGRGWTLDSEDPHSSSSVADMWSSLPWFLHVWNGEGVMFYPFFQMGRVQVKGRPGYMFLSRSVYRVFLIFGFGFMMLMSRAEHYWWR